MGRKHRHNGATAGVARKTVGAVLSLADEYPPYHRVGERHGRWFLAGA